ncbi:MAG: tetratricopeptide repeat protein [Candidatus Riflebacteria bacterium]|nr:tetratricopeptide repeat protein [Candidatus Riflebacteria bacterium]
MNLTSWKVVFLIGLIIIGPMMIFFPVWGAEVASITSLLGKGRTLSDQGRLSEAELLFEEAVKADSGSIEACHWLGCVQASENKFLEAEKNFKKALAIKAEYLPTLIRYSGVLADMNRFPEAEALARKALSIEPENPQVQRVLGQVLLGMGNIQEAMPLLEKVLVKNPHDPDLCNNIGCALSAAKEFDKGSEYFRKGLREDPQNRALNVNLALALRDGGKKGEFLDQYKMIILLDPDNAGLRLEYGKLLAESGNASEAEHQWQILMGSGQVSKADVLKPLIAQNLNVMAVPSSATDELLYPEVSKDDYETLRKKNEAQPWDAHSQYLLGHAALQSGDYAAASRAFFTAVGLNPLSAVSRYSLGKAVERHAVDATPKNGEELRPEYLHMFDEAETSYKKAVRLNPDLIEAEMGICDIYIETRRENMARERLEKLLKEKPQARLVRMNLARLAVRDKKEAEALKLMEAELEINPDDSNVLQFLGNLYAGSKNFSKSVDTFQALASKQPKKGESLWKTIKQEFPDWRKTLQNADPERYKKLLAMAAQGGDDEARGLLLSPEIASGTATGPEGVKGVVGK